MTTRETAEHLKEIYGTDISPELVSRATDAVKELLGLWIDQAEGAKFWLRVLSELKSRGLQDILIAVVDGLSGFPEAIATIFPKTEVQLCIVHMVRNSLKFVPFKDRKPVATGLRSISTAASEEAALSALEAFSAKWNSRFPMISRSWRLRWAELVLFFKFPETIRKVIYTTNAIESLNYTVRKVTRNRLSFPSADAAMKLVFMALQNISKKWTMPIHDWRSALQQFAILYGDRMPL